MLPKQQSRAPVLHLFMLSGQQAYLALSYPENSSELENGIRRLKFPHDAPSRSTLKLEEAFLQFIPRDEWDTRLSSGMNAVDLGACPGGWTYQLVRRGMMVSAVDNGPMNEKLMETGQVKHFREDGFRFEPQRKNIYWLVCDMVEKPARVAELIEAWAINGWFKEAIFNLKLPMKSRYKEVMAILNTMQEILKENGINEFQLQCKHLYHDRDEVTVHLWLKPSQPWN